MLQFFLLLFSLSAFAAENLPAPPPPPPTNLDMGAMRASLLSQDIDTQKVKMRNLPYRSRLIFPNDTHNPNGIVVGNYLGGNGMSAVYEILSPEGLGVVKLPLFYNEKPEESATHFLDAFGHGDEILKKYGVSKVTLTSYLPGSYVTVTRLPLDSLTAEQLRWSHREEQLNAVEALKSFAESTAAFDNIGDLKWNDFHYSPKELSWTLADWADDRADNSFYHVLFDPDLPVSVEFSETARSYFSMLGVERSASGFRLLKGDTPSQLSQLTPEERIQAAKDIEERILTRRRSLITSEDYRRDAARYGYEGEDFAVSLLRTDFPRDAKQLAKPLKKKPVVIQLWRPASTCKAGLAE
ncbi:MAG: hypothetical protein R3A80_09385 [Bdellovibrionota bacterium]